MDGWFSCHESIVLEIYLDFVRIMDLPTLDDVWNGKA